MAGRSRSGCPRPRGPCRTRGGWSGRCWGCWTRARAGRNAFFGGELAARVPGADGELPPGLRDPLLARIELLADPAQQVLRAAAAAGARVGHHLLAEVAGLPEAELLAALREAV